MYLSTPVEQTDNILHWWGVSGSCNLLFCLIEVPFSQHSTNRPVLRSMARDYLAIQGSSTSAERAFSSGSLTGTKQCNRLTPKTFEALQLLKSAYRNGHISAICDAGAHVDARIADLDPASFEIRPTMKGIPIATTGFCRIRRACTSHSINFPVSICQYFYVVEFGGSNATPNRSLRGAGRRT